MLFAMQCDCDHISDELMRCMPSNLKWYFCDIPHIESITKKAATKLFRSIDDREMYICDICVYIFTDVPYKSETFYVFKTLFSI